MATTIRSTRHRYIYSATVCLLMSVGAASEADSMGMRLETTEILLSKASRDVISSSAAVSTDYRHVAYVAKAHGKYLVVADCVEGKPFEDFLVENKPLFSPD